MPSFLESKAAEREKEFLPDAKSRRQMEKGAHIKSRNSLCVECGFVDGAIDDKSLSEVQRSRYSPKYSLQLFTLESIEREVCHKMLNHVR
jgi:hypothetical protein